MTFTSADAFEAADCGEPILMNAGAIRRMLREHGADEAEFSAEAKWDGAGELDAAFVLGWLGY